MLNDEYLQFKDLVPVDGYKKVARFLGLNVKPLARDLFKEPEDSPEDIAGKLFAAVLRVTGETIEARSSGYFVDLVENWRGTKSTVLAVATYYYLHTLRSGRQTAEEIDRLLFGGESFYEKHGIKVPGGYEPEPVARGGSRDDRGPNIPDALRSAVTRDGNVPEKSPIGAPVTFPHPDGIYSACFSSDGKFIVTAGKNNADTGAGVFIWGIENISPSDRKVEIAHDQDFSAYVDVSPDSQFVAAAFQKTAGLFYSSSKLPCIHQFTHDEQIAMLSFSGDGTKIVTASLDGSARVWDTRSGKRVCVMQAVPYIGDEEGHAVNSACFSPGDSEVILGCTNGTVSFWNPDTGKKLGALKRFHGRSWGVSCADYSPDGRLIVTTGGGDRKIAIWDAATRELIGLMGGKILHSHEVWSAEFSPDSRRIVTASADGWALVWDVAADVEIARLKHPSEIFVAHFSPDGSKVLTACEDGNAYLWDISLGAC